MSLLIKHANVIDGAGNTSQPRDIFIANGKIVAIAPTLSVRATALVDAAGGYLAPGIIDTAYGVEHVDPVVSVPTQDHIARYGITTLVTPLHLDGYATRPLRINIMPIATEKGVGIENRDRGFHFSLHPHESNRSQLTKYAEFLKNQGEGSSGPISIGVHTASRAPHFFEEFRRWVKKITAPVVVHGPIRWPKKDEDDFYAVKNPKGISIFASREFFPDWLVQHMKKTRSTTPLKDQWNIRRIATQVGDIHPASLYVFFSRQHPYWNGLSIEEIAKRMECSPVDVVTKIAVSSVGEALLASYEDQSALTIEEFSKNPEKIIVSTGALAPSITQDFLVDTFTVKNKPGRTFEFLKDASTDIRTKMIAAMSFIPARIFGLKNRGMIAPGYIADMQLFDPSFRLRSVFVGGECISGEHVNASARPGVLLTR